MSERPRVAAQSRQDSAGACLAVIGGRIPGKPGRDARARSHSTGSRSEWAHLKDERLKDYLSDMKRLRDLLSHGSDPVSITDDNCTCGRCATVGRCD